MQTIRATLKDHGTIREWTDTKEKVYNWQIGMAGELIIYYKLMHKVISSVAEEEGILTVFAAGQWITVDVLQE